VRLTTRIAIVYAPTAIDATCPKFRSPVKPNWSCRPALKIV
jgi:hypothetical protein